MNMVPSFLLSAFLTAGLLVGCNCVTKTPSVNDGCAEVQTIPEGISCLNGTMIIQSPEGLLGLSDTTGASILEPIYEDIYFITDDICVARKGLDYNIIHKDGHRLAQSEFLTDPTDEQLLSLLNSTERSDSESWELVLEGYSRFVEACRSSRAENVDSLAAEVRSALALASGSMSDEQQSRFKALASSFGSVSKPSKTDRR